MVTFLFKLKGNKNGFQKIAIRVDLFSLSLFQIKELLFEARWNPIYSDNIL